MIKNMNKRSLLCTLSLQISIGTKSATIRPINFPNLSSMDGTAVDVVVFSIPSRLLISISHTSSSFNSSVIRCPVRVSTEDAFISLQDPSFKMIPKATGKLEICLEVVDPETQGAIVISLTKVEKMQLIQYSPALVLMMTQLFTTQSSAEKPDMQKYQRCGERLVILLHKFCKCLTATRQRSIS
uniref:Uncharacterized protein n=1 Tax=Romanomermis culicivorax TaxID=13658 RepID=A0A915IDC0_ROMCU